jgi:hypothetical protein
MKKSKSKRRGGKRRGVINDVPMNNTNIRVRFRKVITFTYTSGQCNIALNPSIAALSKDLAVVYKLYRVTHLGLTFQCASSVTGVATPPLYAINYVPALEAPLPTTAPFLEDYEGPAVGFWQIGRGREYHYRIPSNVLNAMPYNWYETKANGPDQSDLTQGYIISTSNIETDVQTALLDIVIEFQTLEDPEFLASLNSVRDHERTAPIRRLPLQPARQDEYVDVQDEYPEHTSVRVRRRGASHISDRG